MNEAKFTEFSSEYRKALHDAMSKYPGDYGINGPDDPARFGHKGAAPTYPNVCEQTSYNMLDAVRRGTFNKDGRAFKGTCKALNIKYTYKGIEEYLEISR